MKIHEKYMQRCLQLAKNGRVHAMPNPSVGAVIVYNGNIIGEGYTSSYGRAHAEVNAIASVKNPELLAHATIYVSLEPCSHFGKTPPCADLILKHKIPMVVVGASDPNPLVAGNGLRKIADSGAQVISGILEKECIESNIRFFTFHQKKRPYIILKWAQSKDGFIAPTSEKRNQNPEPFWITNTYSRQLVHKWRSEEAAILIGTQTAIDDNPKLDVRDWIGANPVKIVLDQKNRIPKENYIFEDKSKVKVLTSTEIDFGKNPAQQIAQYLYNVGLQSVIIEGGRQTLQTFIDAGIWDEARVFTGEVLFGEGMKAPEFSGSQPIKQSVLQDELLIFKNHDQHNYF
ncbi:bifunctional diaminohydroxyphosphoribosylaminopyrimidine deaminase/5-amino-6-(5-phosphoribosylamino)uracil reductase RibD [Flavobacterium sp. CYK-55]|uniref:bifunctional diaminohydroxyphosphoribosylaminopyrimidine deaminase/5-amino-6-(5-phosphoribosylamino)uracil reductase RibD n=1 Tax=Flavobacterium sp. CYK-55 TaxID=2835529 RepID=UPI001BCFE0A8|nr:bifunctional diaminohydroxyphosphoribosylaminopyrimidine deaminase/5-amino-6-(5-phosphoribosylamino)uracil reductase RibD [Flavobacterium sp. CYK-55]MBS7787489.1 bifunctional diaminohydroxyphosphoribosylaminopyrimidine deaminase/5-amino-6-(5-phosphoribosylamino)uracil reductase RibD [Flavobacterium sp. CYK-55]